MERRANIGAGGRVAGLRARIGSPSIVDPKADRHGSPRRRRYPSGRTPAGCTCSAHTVRI